MNKYLLISVLFWSSLYGQTIRWTKTFGGNKDDYGYSVQQTADNGYIVTGSTKSYGAGNSDVYLIKTDSSSNALWTKTFGGDTTDVGESVQQTFDGGYIITGYTYSYGAGNSDVYLIKTNSDGNCLWTKTFGGTSSDMGNSVQETSDSGFIITGTTRSFGTGYSNVYLIRTTSFGDTLWTKTFGETNDDGGYSVQETSDNGFIIAGYSFKSSAVDVYFIKTNSLGDTLWTKTYGGTNGDCGYSVQETQDSGFIIVGNTYSFGTGGCNAYLIRTTSSGDTLWTRTYGGTTTDYGYSVKKTQDSGFIITGITHSFGAGYYPNIYLIKTNSLGDTLWTRTFGGAYSDYAYSVQETSDNGFIIAGHTNSFGAGGYDVWLIKTDSSGYVGVEEKSKELQPSSNLEFKVIKDKICLSVPNNDYTNIRITIYDLCGRLKQNLFSGTMKQGTYSFTPQIHEKGIYFAKLVIGNYQKTEKLIILK
ncbi:MAG: T9SS type A sorting domain-containing protein [bacterium]|nr:T9SS type A sorting domain-containing protein [bacterium]